MTRAVEAAIGEEIVLMADYNQGLDLPEAARRCRALDDEGLYWIEEPVDAEDIPANAKVARETRTAIQIGENFWSPRDAHRALSAEACDIIMPDVGKIGGISAWLRRSAIGSAYGVPVSSHLYPEVSVCLLSVSPAAHYLEDVDWAAAILENPVLIENGALTPSTDADMG